MFMFTRQHHDHDFMSNFRFDDKKKKHKNEF